MRNNTLTTMEIPEITDEEFLNAKIVFAGIERPTAKWLGAAAMILARQYEEQPEGLEINLLGVKMRLTYEGTAEDDE